jgi:hypothetical protein
VQAAESSERAAERIELGGNANCLGTSMPDEISVNGGVEASLRTSLDFDHRHRWPLALTQAASELTRWIIEVSPSRCGGPAWSTGRYARNLKTHMRITANSFQTLLPVDEAWPLKFRRALVLEVARRPELAGTLFDKDRGKYTIRIEGGKLWRGCGRC